MVPEPQTYTYLVIFFTLISSAFFSGMEIAFVSANRLKIELDKNRGVTSGKVLSFFVKTPFNKLTTLTEMVRAYNREFLSELSLRATDVDIHSEILQDIDVEQHEPLITAIEHLHLAVEKWLQKPD